MLEQKNRERRNNDGNLSLSRTLSQGAWSSRLVHCQSDSVMAMSGLAKIKVNLLMPIDICFPETNSSRPANLRISPSSFLSNTKDIYSYQWVSTLKSVKEKRRKCNEFSRIFLKESQCLEAVFKQSVHFILLLRRKNSFNQFYDSVESCYKFVIRPTVETIPVVKAKSIFTLHHSQKTLFPRHFANQFDRLHWNDIQGKFNSY